MDEKPQTSKIDFSETALTVPNERESLLSAEDRPTTSELCDDDNMTRLSIWIILHDRICRTNIILTALVIIAFISAAKFRTTTQAPTNYVEKSYRNSTKTAEESPNPVPMKELSRKPQQNFEVESPSKLLGKFLVPNREKGCGGLGNKMWIFASMYGLGRKLNRSLMYSSSTTCMTAALDEISHVFPEFRKRIHLANISANETKLVQYAGLCCKYEDPIVLEKEETKFLEISGIFLQNIKYFLEVRNEVNQIFRFSNEVATKADTEAKSLFGSDEFHKLCVYTRRGDFVLLKVGSTLEYTEPAIDFVYKNLQGRYGNVSVVLLGEDKTFLKQIKEDMKQIPSFYIPQEMSRGEDMCFGAHYCNSMIITTPASTFGWWMGYLMGVHWNETGTIQGNQQLGNIYYNSDFAKFALSDTYSFSNFPMNWIPLRVYQQKPVVLEDNETRDDFNRKNISDKAVYL